MSEEQPRDAQAGGSETGPQGEPVASEDVRIEEAWREVGSQFQALGQSLADAFRTTWEREENRALARDMRDSLQDMAERLGQAVKESGSTAEAQRVRHEAGRTTDSLRAAGEQTWREARPRVLSALRELSRELDRLAERLRGRLPEPPSPPAPPESPGE